MWSGVFKKNSSILPESSSGSKGFYDDSLLKSKILALVQDAIKNFPDSKEVIQNLQLSIRSIFEQKFADNPSNSESDITEETLLKTLLESKDKKEFLEILAACIKISKKIAVEIKLRAAKKRNSNLVNQIEVVGELIATFEKLNNSIKSVNAPENLKRPSKFFNENHSRLNSYTGSKKEQVPQNNNSKSEVAKIDNAALSSNRFAKAVEASRIQELQKAV